MKFKDWVAGRYVAEDDPNTGFARDIKNDPTFPDTDDKSIIREHLEGRDMPADTINLFLDEWDKDK